MQTNSISQIKKELQSIPHEYLIEICIKLAKYKKENKEYLYYLLYQSDNQEEYINSVKIETVTLFEEINPKNYFIIKKSVRKILKTISKYCKYANKPTVTIELLIHFCINLKNSIKDYKSNPTLANMFDNQIKKIRKEIEKLHEDLQFDYNLELEKLI